MRRRKDLDEWYEEQLRTEPWIKKAVDFILSGTAKRRILPLLCDECLNDAFVRWLQNERKLFRVFTMPKGRSDEHLWERARQQLQLLVTADRDFLDDRRYPLHKSPGVLYLDASSTEDQIYAFTRFFAMGGFLDLYYRLGWDVFHGSKSSSSREHAQYRSHDPDDGFMMVWSL
jgi:predicted nuclease of predicted toxin-antitoxin system